MDMSSLEKSEATFEIAENEKLPFFTAYTYAFQDDRNLSLQAKGLLAMLLSFGKGWKIYMRDIAKRSKSGREALRKTVKELVAAGYLVQNRVQGEKGRFIGWTYKVYQKPRLPIVQEKQRFDRKTDLPISVEPIDGKTDIGESDNVKYIQTTNINNLNNKQQQSGNEDVVVAELKKIGMAEAGIKEITAAIDEITAVNLIKYAKANKLGAGWLLTATRDPSKRPPPPGSEAAMVYQKENPKPKQYKTDCPKCKGLGGYEITMQGENSPRMQICDCKQK